MALRVLFPNFGERGESNQFTEGGSQVFVSRFAGLELPKSTSRVVTSC